MNLLAQLRQEAAAYWARQRENISRLVAVADIETAGNHYCVMTPEDARISAAMKFQRGEFMARLAIKTPYTELSDARIMADYWDAKRVSQPVKLHKARRGGAK